MCGASCDGYYQVIRGHERRWEKCSECPYVNDRLVARGFPLRAVSEVVEAEVPRKVREWDIERVNEGKGLTLVGGVGTGKTCALCYIAKKLIYQTDRIAYVSCQGLSYTKRRLELMSSIPALVLDDLAAEFRSASLMAMLNHLIDARYNRKLPTFVATNIDLDVLGSEDEYRRLVDRLHEMTDVIVFHGKSKRSEGASHGITRVVRGGG